MKKPYQVVMTEDVHIHIPGGPVQIVSLGALARGEEAVSEGPVVPDFDVDYLTGQVLNFRTKANRMKFLKTHKGKCREVET